MNVNNHKCPECGEQIMWRHMSIVVENVIIKFNII